MSLADDAKSLEEKYNEAIKENDKWRTEKIKWEDTVRRLTIENKELNKNCIALRSYVDAAKHREDMAREANGILSKSKKKLESMLDLCESSCSECKTREELENRIATLECRLDYKNKVISSRDCTIKDLESKLAGMEKQSKSKNPELDGLLFTIVYGGTQSTPHK